MWSVYERVGQQRQRTNNYAEAAHRRVQCELRMDHPTIWALIDGLRKVQKGRDALYEGLVGGREPPQKLKKYRDADTRISRIVANFGAYNVLDYLRGLAHNL